MRGQEEWSSQPALASTKVGKQAGAALNRKTCPTCGEGPFWVTQVAKVESAECE